MIFVNCKPASLFSFAGLNYYLEFLMICSKLTTKLRQFSLGYQDSKLYNSLPNEVINATLFSIFSYKLKRFLYSEYGKSSVACSCISARLLLGQTLNLYITIRVTHLLMRWSNFIKLWLLLDFLTSRHSHQFYILGHSTPNRLNFLHKHYRFS